MNLLSLHQLLNRWNLLEAGARTVLILGGGLAVLGLASRVAVALLSYGSNDIFTWYDFASQVDQVGVRYLYENVQAFNHPPLMGHLAAFALRISQTLDVPFAFWFKLPMILADLLTTLLLWQIWRHRHGPPMAALAVVAFSWSGLSILVSSYHGNTDSLAAFLCLLAAYLLETRRPLAGGLALAGALNVKLIPSVLVPAFVLSLRSRQAFIHFTAGLAMGILPFLPFLICCPQSFYRNVIAYNSAIEPWGIMLFLLHSDGNIAFRQLAHDMSDLYIPNGRFVIIGLTLLMGFWNRFKARWNYYELGAICFSIFLIFAPGFGVQYMVYVCPLLFAVSVRWGTIYSVLAGIFISLVYYAFWTGEFPFRSQFTPHFPMPTPLFGLLVWVLLIQFVVGCVLGQTQASREPPSQII